MIWLGRCSPSHTSRRAAAASLLFRGASLRALAALAITLLLAACGPSGPAPVRKPVPGEVELRPATVVLNWSDPNQNEEGYAVYRSRVGLLPADQGPFELIRELPENTISFEDETAEPGMTYRYRVAAVGGGRSAEADFPDEYEVIEPLRIVRVQSLGETSIVASFTRELDESALRLSNYRFEPDLAVASVELLPSGRDVRIETGRQLRDDYTLHVGELLDTQGFSLWLDGSNATFEGGVPDAQPPRLTAAQAMSPTLVMVTFDEPVREGAGEPANYRISSQAAGESRPSLAIESVELSADGRSVLISTLEQSEVEYQLTVIGIEDIAENEITSPHNRIEFVGIAASGGAGDSDGEGLADAIEQAGWRVMVQLEGGQARERWVTSDPYSSDTDGDGLTDIVEYRLGLDPRESDTDADDLSDYLEVFFLETDPAHQDSDGDGLSDGREMRELRTNPLEADTDGDQFPDSEELWLESRNPRLADLPTFGIEVGDVDLQLDVRFTATNSTGTTRSQGQTSSSTLSTSESSSRSMTDTDTNSFYASTTVSASYEFGLFGGASVEASASTGYTGTWESSFTEESARETQRAYEESTSTSLDLTEDETLERTVEDARMSVIAYLENTGNIAFSLRNVELTALLFDPIDGKYRPIAALVPQSGNSDFNLGLEFPRRGPIVFEAVSIYPNMVEELMSNPQAVSFKVANYDLEDEFGRNFAFTSQDIHERTATLIIDSGGIDRDLDGVGDDASRYRVATTTGRRAADTDGDGEIGAGDEPVLFDETGRLAGIGLLEAMEEILGLAHLDEATTPTTSLSAAERAGSFSTYSTGGVTHLWRIGDALSDPDNRRQWDVIVGGTIDRSVGVDERILRAEESITLAFVRDDDGDSLPARLERTLGSSDQRVESDGDGLDDAFEATEAWTVWTDLGSISSYSSPGRADSDADGLLDSEEYLACAGVTSVEESCDRAGEFPLSPLGSGGPTDPGSADTDGDGIADMEEIEGYEVDLRAGGTVFVQTDPRVADHDGDGADDGLELRLGGNPLDGDDYATFVDTDRDGLTDAQENDGWLVRVRAASTDPGEQGALSEYQAVSDPLLVDSDTDGLSDLQEQEFGTDPSAPDTDGDGLNDRYEVENGLDPLDADMDDDLRSDGDELNVQCTVGPVDGVTYPVSTDPLIADADGDGLVDGVECLLRATDPTVADTDEDGVADGNELAIHTNPLAQDKKLRFTLRSIQVQYDCDSGTNGGDWEGYFKLELPDSTHVLLDANVLDGDDHGTREGQEGIEEGMTWPDQMPGGARSPTREFVLEPGEGIRFFQEDLTETTGTDHEFDDNDPANKINESYDYVSATGCYSKEISDGDNCTLIVNWNIDRITGP